MDPFPQGEGIFQPVGRDLPSGGQGGQDGAVGSRLDQAFIDVKGDFTGGGGSGLMVKPVGISGMATTSESLGGGAV